MTKIDITLKTQKNYPEFTKEVDGLSVEQLNERMATLAKSLADSEEHRENNEALEEAKAKVAELKGPYDDVKKAVRLKQRYLRNLIKEKGGA